MNVKALLGGLAAFSLSLAASTLAQTPPVQPPSAQAAADFSADEFRAHVTFLADDLLEGRDTGSRGHEIAARYVATQFEALGLQPGARGNWFQRIEFARFTPNGPASLTVGGRTFANGTDLVMRASPDTAALAIDAPMVFVGYGIDLPADGYDDYRGLDVRGRIVVVIDGVPAGTPSDVAASVRQEKRRMAAARGAVGMIAVRSRADAARTAWERTIRGANRPGVTWLEAGTPFVDGAGLRFSATVSDTVAEALFQGARRPLTAILEEVARPGGARPRGFALSQSARVTREPATSTRFSSPNVIAMLPGTDPALAGEYVLLMAHLDHIGIREPRPADAANADRINNGAMDNATGIATLIEVARAMTRPGNRPRRPILIAAVTGEERGLLGAEYLSRHPVVDGRVIAVVNLDMPVLTYDFQDLTAFGAEHSTLGPIVARAAARMGVRLSPDPLPEEGLFTRSDHYKFVRLGVPSVFLATGFAGEGRREFRRFLDTRYHSPSDDLSQNFDWAAGAKFARLNYLIAREIADAPEPPLWYSDSFFGDAFADRQRRAPRPANQAAAN